MTGDPDGQQVARVLDVTCLKRGLLRLDGKPMIEWLREQADASGLALPDSLALGANVHQCVFPGGELLAAIRGGATYWRLVYRVAAPACGRAGGDFRPPELNYSGYVAVGHGRGVSVISGFARPVENVYALMVVMLVTGLGVLHRSRGRLFAAMTQAGMPLTASIGAARTEISELSAQLNELQLDLEFGVESYLDGVLIPEAMVEAYQRSLCEAMGIRPASSTARGCSSGSARSSAAGDRARRGGRGAGRTAGTGCSPACSRSAPCSPCRRRCCWRSSPCRRRPAGRYSTRGCTGRRT